MWGEVEFTAAVNLVVTDLPAESGLSESVSSSHIEESSSIDSGELYTSYSDTFRLVCKDGRGSNPSGDSDDDGVRNSLDGCPEQAGPPGVGGCPENACYMHHDFWETYNMYPGVSYNIDPKDGNPIGDTASITFVEERPSGYVFDVEVQDDERREVVNIGDSFSITDAGKQDTKSVGVQLLNVTNVQGDPSAELEATACLATGDEGDQGDGDNQCSPSGCD